MVIGYGSSAVAEVALERAITELQQLKYAERIASGWTSEGGRSLEYLQRYPGMLKLAEHHFLYVWQIVEGQANLRFSKIFNNCEII